MYNINLQHLKVITAIYAEGSMTKAAATLNVSQSALSHHIKELENNTGTIVFERRNKKLWITEAGKKILSSAGLVLHELNKLEQELKVLKSGESGVIRISTECYTTYTWLVKLVRDFSKKYPKAQLQIVTEATKTPFQYLLNGQLDIAIAGKQKDQFGGLQYLPLFKDTLVVILHKDHALAGRKYIHPKDLQGQHILVYDTDEKDIDLLQKVLKPNGIQPAQLLKMQLTEVIIEMIKSNLGLAVMSKWLMEPLMNKDLVMVPFKDAFATKSWQLVCQPNPSGLQQRFIEYVVAAFRENSV
jgi:LysR family transcriptional regulator, regulator for metE and metH